MKSLLLTGALFTSIVALFFFLKKGKVADTKIAKYPVSKYVCMPCGSGCDTIIYDNPGECMHCKMPLVDKSSIVFDSIKPADVCTYIRQHPHTVLLDVRTKEEFEGRADPDFGALQHAINIPVQELEARVNELNAYKQQEIIVYCSHSRRSPQASYRLSVHGFKQVKNMQGGMSVMGPDSCRVKR
jgi:rhodanese-related sulfurtransferase